MTRSQSSFQTIGDSLYYCYDLNDVMTRGVLIDVAALKGVSMLRGALLED